MWRGQNVANIYNLIFYPFILPRTSGIPFSLSFSSSSFFFSFWEVGEDETSDLSDDPPHDGRTSVPLHYPYYRYDTHVCMVIILSEEQKKRAM